MVEVPPDLLQPQHPHVMRSSVQCIEGVVDEVRLPGES